MSCKSVEAITVHMCEFDLRAVDEDGEGLAKKPTSIFTDLPPLASAVGRLCQSGHRHVHLVSGRAKGAAAYTKEFCAAIVQGLFVYLDYLLEAQSGQLYL